MDIHPAEAAKETQLHPLICAHPETGQLGLYGCFGYIIGIDGMEQDEALALLMKLYEWQGRDEFVYRHKWQKDMLARIFHKPYQNCIALTISLIL